MKKLFFPLGVLLTVGALLVVFYKSNKVKVFVVEERPIKKVVYASGYVKPVNYVVVKSEVSGYIQEIRVKEGDKVKKGQILAVIDPGPVLASLKEAEERLKLVRERLREDSDYRKSLQEQVDITKRNMEQAQRYLERRKNLSERGLIPKEQYEEAKRSYENAKSEYQRALAVYEDAITSLKSEEKTLYANKEKIKREIERYYIRSPVDGIVLNRYVEVGDYVNYMSDNKLFSIGNEKDKEVVLNVDEEYASMIKRGMKVFLSLDIYPDKVFEGTVKLVKEELDRNKKTLEVRASAPLPAEVPAGATVEANILVEEKKALVIPISAYKDGYVYKYERVRKVKVPVKVGSQVDGYIEIIEGLKKGDKVIVE
ncbi:efflux RND transporter periplasmic adaptor subunit [Hydrogenobacter hydrogenophilus]|uniref:HlyD family secretion protein n=1 Tax=Hydrogenobacter hydrogenophilus TaxID=35835 RepID=A0A285P234_9AQUI|nr:efflux RND transporter periplasmic adaptor subunit [Hydrogenobacter hydrogenophilus]SNZ13941.1 HlyD family secretion protein [Hydrogenobacter hydrogenophilus]